MVSALVLIVLKRAVGAMFVGLGVRVAVSK
jgi:hypothetical protein